MKHNENILGNLPHFGVGHDNRDQARLTALSVHERLRDVLTARVDALDLLGRHVFTLRNMLDYQ